MADSARAAKLKELANEPLLSPEKLHIYATEWFLGKPHGTVAVLLLDAKRKIITVRTIAEEHLRLPADFPEEILRLCQQMDASNVVLMHNHVDGVMEPSYEDIYLTREIYRTLKDNGITLLEHMIVHELDAIPCLNISMNEEVSGFPTKYKKQ